MPPPPPPPAYRAPAEEVRFEPDEPGLMLLRQNGAVPVTRISTFPTFLWFERGLAPLYAPVCPGPCITRMQPGEYRLALSKDGGRAVPSVGPVDIRGPSAIRASYVDHSGIRTGGVVLAFGGTAAGIVMIALSAKSHDVCDSSGYCFHQTTINTPLAVGGVGVLLGSVIIGSVLASQHDDALITVTPLVAWNRPERTAPMAASLVPSVQGAALTMRF